MSRNLQKYRYLALVANRTRSRLIVFMIFSLQLGGFFLIGITMGYNLCDVMLKSCTRHHPYVVQHESKPTVREMIEVAPIKKQGLLPPKNTTRKKVRRVFKKLPDKFLKDFPPRKPASVFFLEPWKYLERLKSQDRKFFMTFLIKSACPYVERRIYIRRSWGSIASINQQMFGIIFLVGLTRNKEQQDLLEKENKLYGDILQSDTRDDYFHLPTKVLAGFQWITYDLGDVSEFFITTDDDCVINMPTVFDYFFTHREASKNKLHCGYIYDQGSYPIRKKKFKWGVSPDVYPGDIYPAFCHGGMAVWPFTILSEVYNTSETTNCTSMHLEDVLISGILRQKTYNSTTNIVSRGFEGRRGRYRRPEHFVYHLGLSKDLKKSFILRWHDLKKGIRLGNKDPMRAKQFSAYRYNATLTHFLTIPDSSINETVVYFESAWSKLRPRRKPVESKEKANLTDIDKLLVKKENEYLEEKLQSSEAVSNGTINKAKLAKILDF